MLEDFHFKIQNIVHTVDLPLHINSSHQKLANVFGLTQK